MICSFGNLVDEANNLQAAFDNAWSKVVLFSDNDNPVMQKFALSGRLQAEAAWFDSDQGDFDDALWRRFRFGFNSQVFEAWTVHVEADINLDGGSLYNRLTDAYISRSLGGTTIKLGKHSAGFTLDGATSSKSLLALQRSNLANNLWFTAEYFTGVSLTGDSSDGVEYTAGIYSNDPGDEFSHFEADYFGLISIGKNFGESFDLDKALVRVDFVRNGEDPRANTRHFGRIGSLVTQWEKDNWGFWTDISLGAGFGGQSDLWGASAMPFLNFSEYVQLVLRYTYLDSETVNGIRLGRYESSVTGGRGDNYREFYGGLNIFLYGHKLKWQTGLQYTRMKDAANDGGRYTSGFGVTTGIRVFW